MNDSRPIDASVPGQANATVDGATGRGAATGVMSPPDLLPVIAYDLCRSCNATVIRCLTESGKTTVIDAAPVENGNIVLWYVGPDRKPIAHVIKGDERAKLEDIHDVLIPLRLFISHFATCPDADRWRKR